MLAPRLRTAAAALACAALLGACNGGGDDAGPSPTPEPTDAAPASPTPDASVARTAEEIAEAIGCTDRRPGQKDAGDPVDPVEAVDCTLDGTTYRIRTYASNADRDRVLEAAPVDGGYRNVGERSLVATTTQQAADIVLEKLGHPIVDLRYTTPGS